MATCTGHRHSDGGPCGNFPPAGGNVCRSHGGASPQVIAKRRRRLALAKAGKQLGVGIEVDPTEALLHALWIAYGDLAFWSGTVTGLRGGAVDDLGNGLVVRGAQGASQAHVYVQQYNEAQERVMRFAKMAKDAGIEERRVQLLEEQATMIAEVGRRFLAKIAIALSLTREQSSQARELFREQFALLEPAK